MSEKLNTIKQQLRRMLETIDNCEKDGVSWRQNGNENHLSESRQNNFNFMSANSPRNYASTSRTCSSTSQSQSTGGGFASRAVDNFRWAFYRVVVLFYYYIMRQSIYTAIIPPPGHAPCIWHLWVSQGRGICPFVLVKGRAVGLEPQIRGAFEYWNKCYGHLAGHR